MRFKRFVRAARVVHPFPSFMVAATSVALAFVADAHGPASRYLAIGIGMLLYQFAIGTTNDVADVESDRVAKPWKPLAAGLLPVPIVATLAVLFGVGGLALTAMLSAGAWLIGVVLLGCGLAYDFWLKRTVVSWLPYAVAFSLLPVWVFVASDAWRPLIWWVLPLGMLLGLALHLANQAPDVSDNADEFLGLPQLLGTRGANAAALGCFIAAAALAAIVLSFTAARQAWVGAAIGASVLLLSPTIERTKRDDALFGLLALGAAGLAIVFLSAV